jgi:hypothetical protein
MVQLNHDDDEFRLSAKRGRGVKIDRPYGKKYLVCHVSKFKRSDVVGMYKHIQREMKTTTNEDIEFDKTALNYDLSGFDKKTMNYSDEVEKRIRERFKGIKSIRKDATVMVGVIVSATPELFDDMTEQQERQYFQTAFDFLSNYFGRKNVVSATVHKDEKTPHLHFNFVPLTADGRLSAKELVNQQALLHLQENLPKELQKMGFKVSRGLPSKQTGVKHENPRDWKIRTAKNELERTEHITTERVRRTSERERITATTKQEIGRRLENLSRHSRTMENGSKNRVSDSREDYRSTENRVQNGNSESRSDFQNMGNSGNDLGNNNRGIDENNVRLKQQFSEKLKKSRAKINQKSRPKNQGCMKI